MRLLLSAFGVGTTLFHEYFYRMPAVSMSTIGPRFIPDYPVLLLFDEFVVDAKTVERVRDTERRSWYGDMAAVFEALDSSGRLVVKDFDEVVKPHMDAIQESVGYDLRNIQEWAPVFEESISRWRAFSQMGKQLLSQKTPDSLSGEEYELRDVFEHGYYGHSVSLEREFGSLLQHWKSRMPREDRDYARTVVGHYLSYISANLCIAGTTDSMIHDWQDIEPIYRKKFKLSLRAGEEMDKMAQARRLFAFVFPEFHLEDVGSFVKALDDKRIESLRALINSAASGDQTFDEAFATATLREVLKAEQKASFRRKVVGWATLPLGFIPWLGAPLQKAADEGISRPLEASARKDKEWYYLVSEMST